MKYKCHYCAEYLKPGVSYTLECSCGNCHLGFSRDGEVETFHLTFFEKGVDIFLLKSKYSDKVTLGKGKSLFRSYMQQAIIEVPAKLHFDAEGTPQVYTLWEKLSKLVIFS